MEHTNSDTEACTNLFEHGEQGWHHRWVLHARHGALRQQHADVIPDPDAGPVFFIHLTLRSSACKHLHNACEA